MNRLLLRALNGPLFVLIVMVAVALQASLFKGWPASLFQPDLVIVAVVWCGLKRDLVEGSILTLIFGEIAEVHSSAPQGILMLCYVITFLLTLTCLRLFVLKGRRSWILLTGLGSVLWKAAFLSALYLLDLSDHQWRHTLTFLIPNTLVTCTLAWFAFPWLDRFDTKTWKSDRIRQAIEGDLLLSDDDEDWS